MASVTEHPAGGFILLTALLVLAVLAAICLGISSQVRLHVAIAGYDQDDAKVRRLQEDGFEYAKSVLKSGKKSSFSSRFEPVEPTILGHNQDEELQVMMVDDAGKLNINEVDTVILQNALTEITGVELTAEELTGNIMDWIDSDSVGEAEAFYYQSQNPPYAPRNAALQRLEELLYVKDMTPQVFYGEDANHNGVLDLNENDGDVAYPSDNMDGVLQLGLRDYFGVSNASALNINSVPEHVWVILFRTILTDDTSRANEFAQRIIRYRAGGDQILGTEDDQRFQSPIVFQSALGSGGAGFVELLQNCYPLDIDAGNIEVTVQAALRKEKIIRTARAVFSMETGKPKMMEYQNQ